MPDILRLAKQWVRKGERSVDDKYLPQTNSPFGKAQNNSRWLISVHMIKHYGSGQDMQAKGEFFTIFYFKELPRGSLLEHAVLFRFRLSQISQQLRHGNQAHAPTQTRFLWNYLCANQFKYQESKQLYTRHLQSMDRATIRHLHDKSVHGFPHI